ncbi:hypothetical protein JHL18_02665 [Clostridium sp. YIM B02505]|uniref:Peptidase S8/S53 domain-containing protein n=1 Tax=Clostridium yunnanense TaxID=2800325 RepID=A0ABS1EJP3_9CLOT|nr:S8 family serine peptidase [Clostridium yunnanense]MBK1809548.1 hypothetical protein [Clostridium yunnanense]
MCYKEFKKKVIVIDSGINVNDEFLCDSIIGGVCIEVNNEKIIFSNNYMDENGHGTFCSKIIKYINEEIGIYVIKILNKNMKCSCKTLIEALKYTKNININLICLSLATINELYADDLRNICSDLRKNGKILVSSLHNDNYNSYPATFEDVIGVEGILDDNLYCYDYYKDLQIQCKSSSMPILLQSINGQYRYFRGNSKANALFCGLLLKDIENVNNLTLKELEDYIDLNLKGHKTLYKHNKDMNINKSQMFESVKEIYIEIFGEHNFSKLNIYDKCKLFTSKRCIGVIESIEKKWGVEIEKEFLHQKVFYSIDSLIKYLDLQI